jgi:hypothetical protein
LLFFLTQRLAQLNWSREDLAAQGGPSPSTVYKTLAGGRRPTERTLARLELALGWQAGSAHRILEGGAPSVSITQQVATFASRIDRELARGESLGVARTAKELREFLLGVAVGLQHFYAGAEHTETEVFHVSAD